MNQPKFASETPCWTARLAAKESPGTFVAKPELKGGDAWYVGRPDMGSFVLLEAGPGRVSKEEVSPCSHSDLNRLTVHQLTH